MTTPPRATTNTPGTSATSIIAWTTRLVAASSQNPGEDERAVATVIDEACAELGLPMPVRVGSPSRPNLLVRLDFGPGGRRLGLCAHTDTKPIGAGEWSTDPLTVTELDGALHGRGTVDMKGALATMLLTAAELAADPPARGSLVLIFAADEENGAVHGGRWLAEHAPVVADAIVIGEPGGIHTDWDRLHLGSRGICNFDIEVTTAQGHSSLRDAFGLVSATEVAADLVVELRRSFIPPMSVEGRWTPTMNPGVVIEGGINYGVLPGWARVASECRLVPGMQRERFESALENLLRDRLPDGARGSVTIRNWIPATAIETDAPIAQAARDALRTVLGTTPPDDMFPGTTDATWFEAMGVPCLPALGPGLLEHAHATDERVSLTSLVEARELYVTLARSFCEQPA